MHGDEEDARNYRKNFVASRDRSPARWDEEPLPYSERCVASIHCKTACSACELTFAICIIIFEFMIICAEAQQALMSSKQLAQAAKALTG
jgi:hypothetical protein